jgi:MFS transporter, DHA1 family, inner membrane transport protein
LSGSPEKATHAAAKFDSSPLPHKAVLYLLVAMQVTHIVDFMVLMPLGGSLMKLFSLTPTQFSLAVGSYTFAAGVSGLLIAGFADRFDRKKLLLVAYGGLAFATLACALAPNFATLVTARIFAGIFGGVMSGVVYAIVGDLIPPSHRGRAMGLVGVSFPLAATIGVPFSLFIATHLFDWRAPFIALFIICVALWWFAWAKLPNVRSHLENKTARDDHPMRTVWNVFENMNHLNAFGLTALLTFSVFSIVPFIAPVFTKNEIISEQALPFAYAIGGIATFFSVQKIGALSDRFGHLRVFRWTTLALLIPLLITTSLQAAPLGIVFLVWALFMVGTSSRWTPAFALITSAAAPKARGSFLSVNAAVMQFASSLGTFVGGAILTQLPNGKIGHFIYVGVMSLAVSLAAYAWAGRIKNVA